ILIVDDEVGIRELLSEILQDEGYRVSLAENATAARAYRARERPALVLLDIWMPDTDGVTLLREWAAAGQLTMPVIMMSGHGTIDCSEIGQYAKAEQRGLAFLLPKLDKANVTLVCTSTEPLGNMAAESKFDPALLAALSTGAVLLPPLRARREDIPPLIERFW